MGNTLRIAHLTSAHERHDTRIFLKMCRSLVAAGHDVFLVVADGLGAECRDGVTIVDTGKSHGRADRMLGTTGRVFREAVALDADIYHFHDPELLFAGLALKWRGKRVIYDSHEDLPRDILSKTYLPAVVRRPIAIAAELLEAFASQHLDFVVTATPEIADRFAKSKAVVVQNYPMTGELHRPDRSPMRDRPREFAYVGGLCIDRGMLPMLDALAQLPPPAALNIAGSFSIEEEEDVAQARPGWERVRFLGWAAREAVAVLLSNVRAGLVLFSPLPNNVDGRPNKLFEYMSAGLPVIASDFPRWREIVEGADCGLLVDPEDPNAIAKAMQWVLDHPDEASAMGDRGHQAVLDRYNWDSEAGTLVELYRTLGSGVRSAG